MRIYVGNLGFGVTDADLQAAFAAHGEVASANVITDRETGQSRGFGFVEITDQASAEKAISALNGAELQGRALVVNQARERAESGSRRRW